MAVTGHGFQWWSRATAGIPSRAGCSGDGEGERAAPGSLPGMAAWLVCQGLTTAGGFRQSWVKRVTVRREGWHWRQSSEGGPCTWKCPARPSKGKSCKPCLFGTACCAVARIAKAQRGCHQPLLQSSWHLPPVPPTPICAFLGAPSRTHQAAEAQTTQLPAGTL